MIMESTDDPSKNHPTTWRPTSGTVRKGTTSCSGEKKTDTESISTSNERSSGNNNRNSNRNSNSNTSSIRNRSSNSNRTSSSSSSSNSSKIQSSSVSALGESSASSSTGGVRLPANLMKSLRRKVAAASASANASLVAVNHSSEVGSNNSSNIEGNNSDNSALVSLGNTSFGFNFDDSEEAMSNGSPTQSPDQSDSDGGGGARGRGGNSSSNGAGGANNTKRGANRKAGSAVASTAQHTRITDENGRGNSEGEIPKEKLARGESDSHQSESDRAEKIKTVAKPVAKGSLAKVQAKGETKKQDTESEVAAAEGGSDSKKSAKESRSTANGTKTSPEIETTSEYHDLAAEAAVAQLHSIASNSFRASIDEEMGKRVDESGGAKDSAGGTSRGKRSRIDNDSERGYNSDDESSRMASAGGSGNVGASHPNDKPEDITSSTNANTKLQNSNTLHSHLQRNSLSCGNGNSSDCSITTSENEPRGKKKKRLNDKKREERNAREKERSFRISKQINDLRGLLSTGGVIVPKGTKSSVLTETANYIRMLQQHQYRAEIDRHQLVQQIQMIGGGAHGPQAAAAIRHVAAQNGITSFANFSGQIPITSKSTSDMEYYQQQANSGIANSTTAQNAQQEQQEEVTPLQQTRIEDHDYRSVFKNCSVGMAIASMGGAFIDCNVLFCKLSNYTKQEVCALTIFNLTSRQDLQHAFDLISRLISPSMDSRSQNPAEGAQTTPGTTPQPVVLRGAMNSGLDLGLSVTLIKAEDGIAKCFCVTLIKNPSSPFDNSRPVPATIELIHGAGALPQTLTTRHQSAPVNKDGRGASLESSPAFTSG